MKPKPSEYLLKIADAESKPVLTVEASFDTCRRLGKLLVVVACFTWFSLLLVLVGWKLFEDNTQSLFFDLQTQWWAILNLFVLLLLVGLTTQLNINVRARTKVNISLMSIESLESFGLESPRYLTELARRKMYWPLGEVVLTPIACTNWPQQLGEKFERVHKEGKYSVCDIKCDYYQWKSFRDKLAAELNTLNKESSLSASSGHSMLRQRFIWLLVKQDDDFNLVLMNENLVDILHLYKIDWSLLVDNEKNYAGCKASLRRKDGEWIGVCGGDSCFSVEHKLIQGIFKKFTSLSETEFYFGTEDHSYGITNRTMVGFVEYFTPSSPLKAKQDKPVWKLYNWKDAHLQRPT